MNPWKQGRSLYKVTSNIQYKLNVSFVKFGITVVFCKCCRVILAVLHYNENSNREHARRMDGQLQWQVSYPRGRDGPVLKPVKGPQTFG